MSQFHLSDFSIFTFILILGAHLPTTLPTESSALLPETSTSIYTTEETTEPDNILHDFSTLPSYEEEKDMFLSKSISKSRSTTTEPPDPTTTTSDQPMNDISNITDLPLCHQLSPDHGNEKNETDRLSEILQSIKSGQGIKNLTVNDLKMVNFSDSTLLMSWKPPNDTTNELQAYIIEWTTPNGNLLVGACRTSNDTLNLTIPALNTCKTYQIRVTPATNERLGEQIVVVVSTGLTVDSNSVRLGISANSTDWLNINWSVTSHDCVTNTIITYCDHVCHDSKVNTTSFNATNLLPCMKYNFTVALYGQAGEFGRLNITGHTQFLRPEKPPSAWTEAGNKSLQIYWTAPVGYTCVKSYRVTISSNESTATKSTSDTRINFGDLTSCSIYEVVITPVHQSGGESDTKRIFSNVTYAPVPPSPLLHKQSVLSSREVLFAWNLMINETNNCENTQIFTQCDFKHVLGEGYDGTNGTNLTNITVGSRVNITNVTIDILSPFTEYICYSFAYNSRGNSSKSEMIRIFTSEDVPSEPQLKLFNISDKNFTFNWEKPQYIPGNITNFKISYTWFYKFHQPDWCKDKQIFEETVVTNGSTFTLTFTNGTPFSKYKVQIMAMTAAGWGNSTDADFDTWPGAPGPVSNLTINIKENPFDKNILDSFLEWGIPCLMHASKIDYFNITWLGHRLNYPTHFFSDRLLADSTSCFNDTCKKKVVLREEYKYKFFVYGKVKDYAGLGEGRNTTATYPAGIPPGPDPNYTQQITMDPYKTRRSTSSATILLPLFPNTYGDIRCYAIIVAKSGFNNESFSRLNLSAGEWPETASWRESMLVDFQIPYQAAKYCDNLSPSFIVDYGKLKAIKYVIGEDSETCPELSSKHERSYCNGPLMPDTWYDVKIRAFTNGGYRDSTIFTVKTNAELRVAIVIGTIFGILFLGVLTTLMLLVRKCSIQAVLRRFLNSDMPGSPVPTPFNRRKFITHCQQLADNPGKLSNEFQLLQTLSVDLQMPTNAACLQANRKKNRYTDILPYDFSRVKLDPIDNDPNSDYINASFIKGFSGEEEYIACQGPKEETTQDFWRMIDQFDVKLIVMLTQLVEKNKEKCHQYYPTIRETFNYENMCIRCTSELDYRAYTQRTLLLQKEYEKRTIIHLHFKDWPDHDVPEDFDPMINFCQMMRRHIVANRGLAVIHCSAGIGRTGTLIAIDILLQHIKENRKLDVFGTVYRLRHHRINMVQRESQYAYIYNCIRQVLKNPYFSKSYKPPSVDPITENNCNNKNGSSMTNLVSSLETLKKSSFLSSSVQSADQICENSSLSSSSSASSSPTLENCLLLRRLQCAKSVPAIHSKPTHRPIVRYKTMDFSNFGKSIPGESSSNNISESQISADHSTSSTCEVSKPQNEFENIDSSDDGDDSTVTQKLLNSSI